MRSQKGKRGGGWLQEVGGRYKKRPGENPRVCRLGGLGPVWATLASQNFIFFCKLNFDN